MYCTTFSGFVKHSLYIFYLYVVYITSTNEPNFLYSAGLESSQTKVVPNHFIINNITSTILIHIPKNAVFYHNHFHSIYPRIYHNSTIHLSTSFDLSQFFFIQYLLHPKKGNVVHPSFLFHIIY
jgi:hypothetical protein